MNLWLIGTVLEKKVIVNLISNLQIISSYTNYTKLYEIISETVIIWLMLFLSFPLITMGTSHF